MNFQSKFGSCITTQTLNVAFLKYVYCRTELWTEGQIDGQFDYILYAHHRPFRLGHKNIRLLIRRPVIQILLRLLEFVHLPLALPLLSCLEA